MPLETGVARHAAQCEVSSSLDSLVFCSCGQRLDSWSAEGRSCLPQAHLTSGGDSYLRCVLFFSHSIIVPGEFSVCAHDTAIERLPRSPRNTRTYPALRKRGTSRYERMTRGRRREHYQWNMDIWGVEGVEAEAELLAAIVAFLERVGLGPEDIGIKVYRISCYSVSPACHQITARFTHFFRFCLWMLSLVRLLTFSHKSSF